VPDYVLRLERGRARSVMPGLVAAFFRPRLLHGSSGPDGQPASHRLIRTDLFDALIPVVLAVATFGAGYWYVAIHNAPQEAPARPAAAASAPVAAAQRPAAAEEKPQELGAAEDTATDSSHGTNDVGPPEEMTSIGEVASQSTAGHIPEHFFQWFWALAAVSAVLLGFYYWRMDGEQLEILKQLISSVVPLGVLTFVVLAVILFGITTAPESAASG